MAKFNIEGAEFIKNLITDGSSASELFNKWFPSDIREKIRKLLNLQAERKALLLSLFTSDKLKEAFQDTYKETISLRKLKEKIEEVVKDADKYPCFAVFQASGYGKSRLISENAKKNHLTLYWCLRPLESGGYPPRSDWIADQMSDLLTVRATETAHLLLQETNEKKTDQTFLSTKRPAWPACSCYYAGAPEKSDIFKA